MIAVAGLAKVVNSGCVEIYIFGKNLFTEKATHSESIVTDERIIISRTSKVRMSLILFSSKFTGFALLAVSLSHVD